MYDTLYDFVPAWLQPSLWAWVESLLQGYGRSGYLVTDEDKLHMIERRLRIEFVWMQGAGNVLDQLKFMMRNDKAGKFGLDIVDLLLADMPVTSYRDKHRELDQSLKEAGSAWTVSARGGVPGLVRRVDQTVEAAAAYVMDESGRPGDLLAKAWRHVYGRSPDPSGGYRDAVRAVEAAAQPIVSPNNSRATLGTMIADLKRSPDHWSLSLVTPIGFDKMDGLVKMLELLWKAQLDRHGTADETIPLNVSPAEAETALHLAVTLVHWFTKRAVTRKTANSPADSAMRARS